MLLTNENHSRIHALDGLRGYAALMVVFYHSILLFMEKRPAGHHPNDLIATNIWSVPSEDIVARILISALNGQTAVIIFFAISGAVLFRSLKANSLKDWLILPFEFTLKRAARIYPALVVCLVCFYGMFEVLHYLRPETFSPFTTKDLIENATLHSITMHGASWTLQVEMLAIPFLLVAFALKRCLGVFALFAVIAYSLLVRDMPSLSMGSASAYLWMPAFAVGMLATELSGSSVIKEATSKLHWAVFLFALFFISIITNPNYASQNTIQFVALFFVIAHVMGGGSSAFKTFLSLPISQYLGKISYSLYLWNVPFLFAIHVYLLNKPVGDNYLAAGIGVGLLLTLITIPVAHLSERYIERSYKLLPQRKSIAAKKLPAC